MYMKIYIQLLLLIVPIISLGQSFDYFPSSTTGEIITHTNYTLSYSERHEQAEWVAYELTKEEVTGSVSRTDNFRSDPLCKDGSAMLIDYKGSGYDRGHLAPAADMKMNYISMSESFYLSNMSPQSPSFNRGAWKSLESAFRNWAVSKGQIYIITGGVLVGGLPFIGTNEVSIPNYYYKIALYFDGENTETIAFLMPNIKCGELSQYIVSIDEIEEQTGIDFFPSLEDGLENELEKASGIGEWVISSKPSYKSTTISTNDNSTSPGASSNLIGKSVQCSGTTKSGNRCKRKTTSTVGRCYQH